MLLLIAVIYNYFVRKSFYYTSYLNETFSHISSDLTLSYLLALNLVVFIIIIKVFSTYIKTATYRNKSFSIFTIQLIGDTCITNYLYISQQI